MPDFCCGMPSLAIIGGIAAYCLTFWRSSGKIRDTLGIVLDLIALAGAGICLYKLGSFSLFWAFLLGNLIGCAASYIVRLDYLEGQRLQQLGRFESADTSQSQPAPEKAPIITQPMEPPLEEGSDPEADRLAGVFVERMLRDLETARENTHVEHYEAIEASYMQRGQSQFGTAFERELRRQKRERKTGSQ